jgi:UDP-N-acetylmuramyl tripeptide synthase
MIEQAPIHVLIPAHHRTHRGWLPHMKTPAIIAAKGASSLSRILRLGSGLTYPGVIAERMHPRIISDLARTLIGGAAIVTGTNGKTTTSKMLGDTLASVGHRVVRNDSGSNLRQGIASTFVRSAEILGSRLDGDLAVLELDEATMPRIVADIAPRLICVTNLLRDQLDRFGELDTIADLVGRAIADAPGSRVLLNADDPIVASLARHVVGDVAYFGVADATLARHTSGRGQNVARCPECGESLRYATSHYAHLGDWHCANCGLARPPLDFFARDVHLHADRSDFILSALGESIHVELPIPGLHNVYNAVAAGACATVLGMAPSAVAEPLGAFSAPFGRAEDLDVDGSRVVLMLAKNPSGAELSLASVLADEGPKSVGIALNDNAADGTDVSWIWDVDFEAYDMSACRMVLAGTRAEDIALRLKYAGVEARNLRVCHDPAEAVSMLAHRAPGTGAAHMIATYTAMLQIRNAFAPAHDRFASLGRRLGHGV